MLKQKGSSVVEVHNESSFYINRCRVKRRDALPKRRASYSGRQRGAVRPLADYRMGPAPVPFTSYRFLANRSMSDFERGNVLLTHTDVEEVSRCTSMPDLWNESLEELAIRSPQLIEPGGALHAQHVQARRREDVFENKQRHAHYLRCLRERGDIFAFNDHAFCHHTRPQAKSAWDPDSLLAEIYDGETYRCVSSTPDRILDAPGLQLTVFALEDFYFNPLDWSYENVVGLALGARVYLYSVDLATVTDLCTHEDDVCVVRFAEHDQLACVGCSTGLIAIYDTRQRVLVREFDEEEGKVCAAAWNCCILATGTRNGHVFLYDLRSSSTEAMCKIEDAHEQLICNLRWSPCQRFCASGGNDDRLCVWDTRMIHGQNAQCPAAAAKHVLCVTAHKAAVKALAWCPWRFNYLASGGGTADRSIILTNVGTGEQVFRSVTGSQVSGLEWSCHRMELVSCHGYSSNKLYVWNYGRHEQGVAELTRIATLAGHEGRVIAMALSPDAKSVVSVGADQRLKFWKCFDAQHEPHVPKGLMKHPVSLIQKFGEIKRKDVDCELLDRKLKSYLSRAVKEEADSVDFEVAQHNNNVHFESVLRNELKSSRIQEYTKQWQRCIFQLRKIELERLKIREMVETLGKLDEQLVEAKFSVKECELEWQHGCSSELDKNIAQLELVHEVRAKAIGKAIVEREDELNELWLDYEFGKNEFERYLRVEGIETPTASNEPVSISSLRCSTRKRARSNPFFKQTPIPLQEFKRELKNVIHNARGN